MIEAPSNEVMARIAVELGSRGTINITTLPAIEVKAFVEMMRSSTPVKEGSGKESPGKAPGEAPGEKGTSKE